ncbi:CHAT domain-containing protein [Deinococcus sonorensis]|uniref:CHAT domain-containing protein n=2 Tax=Deinococcus sonorensis TaxID=309891 RepID=A0AAU7UE08_9DEIO
MTRMWRGVRARGGAAALALLLWAGSAVRPVAAQGSADVPSDVLQAAQAVAAYQQSDFPSALKAFQAAYAARAARLGAESVETLQLLTWIGWTDEQLGQPAEALQAFQQEQAVLERVIGAASLDSALLVAYIGVAQRDLGQLDAADAAFRQALERLDRLVPQGTENTAWVLQQRGRLAVQRSDDAVALPLLQRSLSVYRAALGLDAPELAPLDEDLANVFARARRFSEALPLYAAALAGYQRSYGPDHPFAARIYAALAQTYRQSSVSDFGKSLAYDRLYIGAFLANQQAAFQTLDTDGKVRYNQQLRSELEHYFETVFIDRMADEAGSRPLIEDAFSTWLTYKGSAFALENGLSALLGRADPQLRAQVERYLALRRELAAVSTVQPLSAAEATASLTRVAGLRTELSALEAQLSGQLGRFQDLLLPGRIEAQDLQAVLQPGEVYLDYVWSDNNLFAYAYRWDGRLDVQWLPVAGRLAPQFEALRRGAEGGASLAALQPQTTFFYDQLLRPLEASLAGAHALVVSPDGPLNFLPFELLSDGHQALLERFVIRYVPSGRDLLRLRRAADTVPLSPPAVFGNPAFADEAAPESAASRGVDPPPATGVPGPRAALPTLARLLRGTVFPALPGTETEARTVARLLGTTTRTYLGQAASSAHLFELRSPSVLHVGTHGFFLGTDQQRRQLPNPLLRVGLALEGAQQTVNGRPGDGLLSGLQLAGLSLDGTQLVVLSACETALGDAVAGEGVAGLNQAFLTAGARRIILSQWRVPDAETGQLMAGFYRRYTGGSEPAEALRQAKLDLMRQGLPPRDWAAFLLSGR